MRCATVLWLHTIATRFTNIAMSVLNQDYIGDINILPPKRYFNPFRILAFLSEDEIGKRVRTATGLPTEQ